MIIICILAASTSSFSGTGLNEKVLIDRTASQPGLGMYLQEQKCKSDTFNVHFLTQHGSASTLHVPRPTLQRLADPPITSSSKSMIPSELSNVDRRLRLGLRTGIPPTPSSSSSPSSPLSSRPSMRGRRGTRASISSSLSSVASAELSAPSASSSASSAGFAGCGFGSSFTERGRGRGWSRTWSGIYTRS